MVIIYCGATVFSPIKEGVNYWLSDFIASPPNSQHMQLFSSSAKTLLALNNNQSHRLHSKGKRGEVVTSHCHGSKVLDDNKSKRRLKSGFDSWTSSILGKKFHLICQMLAKSSGLNAKGPSLSLEQKNFCVVLTYSIKWASEIRKFHPVVQQWLRNVQKSVIHMQSCSFANLNLLLLLWSRNIAPMVTWRHTSPVSISIPNEDPRGIWPFVFS